MIRQGRCTRCGESYVMADESDLVHLVLESGEECGGDGFWEGTWHAPGEYPLRFTEGARVTLRANPDEGWDREEGVVLEYEEDYDVYMVRIDESYRTSSSDDGLREVTVDQIEWEDA